MSWVWTHLLGVIVASVLGLSEPELTQALRGEVPTRTESFVAASGKAAGRGVGAIVINKSLEQTWAVLCRFDNKAEYMPRLEKVSVLSAEPGRIVARMQVDAAVTTARYTAIFVIDAEARAIRWTLDKSAADNSIADTIGSYELHPISEDRTLVVYRSFVDSGRSVPRFVSDYMTRRAIPNLLRAIKKRIESGGVWRK